MALYVSQTLPDGSQIIGDDANPNVEVILKAGQFDEIAHLPEPEQRHRLREFLAMNKAGPDPRTELERTMAENASQGQGERQNDRELNS